MTVGRLHGIGACVFDAYGTLFDVHSAVAQCRRRFGIDEASGRTMSETWRTRQLQYSWLRSLMGRHADFWQVTGDALDFALDTAFGPGAAPAGLRTALMDSYLALHAYPEVQGVLGTLKAGGIKTAVLSNGSPAMLEAVCASSGLASLLDAVISIEEAGIYKPHPSVYRLAIERLGLPGPAAVSFQSSNAWDAAAAAAFGFRVVWCNRLGQPPERLPGKPDVEVTSLAPLPGIVGL